MGISGGAVETLGASNGRNYYPIGLRGPKGGSRNQNQERVWSGESGCHTGTLAYSRKCR